MQGMTLTFAIFIAEQTVHEHEQNRSCGISGEQHSSQLLSPNTAPKKCIMNTSLCTGLNFYLTEHLLGSDKVLTWLYLNSPTRSRASLKCSWEKDKRAREQTDVSVPWEVAFNEEHLMNSKQCMLQTLCGLTKRGHNPLEFTSALYELQQFGWHLPLQQSSHSIQLFQFIHN